MDISKTGIQLFAIGALLLCQQAQATAQPAKQAPLKLQCKGILKSYDFKMEPTEVSGVLVEITNDTVRVYSVPLFPNYQDGFSLKIFKKNPATIFAKNAENTIDASVNRYSGQLNLTHYTDASHIMLSASFEGNCINPKPIF